MSEIVENGPWRVGREKSFVGWDTFVESEDFTHDARLIVDGDFEGPEQRLAYAEEIARRLNAFETEALLGEGIVYCWEGGPQDASDGCWTTCMLTDGHDGPHKWTRDDEVIDVFRQTRKQSQFVSVAERRNPLNAPERGLPLESVDVGGEEG